MSDKKPSVVPPDVARYLQGPTPESRQFDFLIGDWEVDATRYQPDGSVQLRYKARWLARYLDDGRIVMDEFKAYAPTGQQIACFVTLRTFCEATGRWEMTGLAAFQPVPFPEWHGIWTNGEMLLDAVGAGPDGTRVRTRIRFSHIETQCFAWESRVSTDDGTSWSLSASLTANRAQG
jgi:hypothetical protein